MELSAPVMIYAYWAAALLVGITFFRKDLATFNPRFDTRRILLLLLSLGIVALNAFIYSKSTTDGGRVIDPASIAIFTVGNGIAETFFFYACFRIGEGLASKFTANPLAIFFLGFLCFIVYSGLIHGLFWLNVLPEHVVQTSPFKPFFMPVQLLIACSWALTFFWYRDIRTVIMLHALVDLTMAWNVKFSMFA